MTSINIELGSSSEDRDPRVTVFNVIMGIFLCVIGLVAIAIAILAPNGWKFPF